MADDRHRAIADPTRPATFFAPPERRTPSELEDLCQAVLASEVTTAILDAVSGYAMVLNETRQILGINRELAALLERSDPVCFTGLRPGELLGCLHVPAAPAVCGTGVSCRSCGAVLAILGAQGVERPVEEECSLLQQGPDGLVAMEFKVRASPLRLAGHLVVVLVLQDISAAKRRNVLERVFLHDMQNVLTGLVGLGELARDSRSDDLVDQIVEMALELGEDIRTQGTLLDAEQGQLSPVAVSRTAQAVLAQIEELATRHRGQVRLFSAAPKAVVNCDQRLLSRVLLNMVTNGLEASAAEETVEVQHQVIDGRHEFSVHNAQYMTQEVQNQVFHRSFSTKPGLGRGLGTYGMKLLAEKYLNGKVSFESSRQRGTVFRLSLPAS